MQTEIRTGKRSIDEVLDEHREKAVDEPREAKMTGPDRQDIAAAMDMYLRYLDTPDDLKEAIFVLTPTQISAFLKATRAYADSHHYSWRTGFYISKLIQNSYDAGFNNFTLDTRKPNPLIGPYCNIGIHLKGKRERPLRLDVEGDLAAQSAKDAHHLIMHVNGWIGGRDAITYATNCKFIIQGGLYKDCARGFKNCYLTVREDVGVGSGKWAEQTEFRVYNEQAAESFIAAVPENRLFGGLSGNRIILVQNNREVVLRDYGRHN